MTWDELEAFTLGDGRTVRLINRAGIWNPRDLSATLSIITSADGPYADREAAGGILHYAYQSGSSEGRNAKLRRAMELGLPLIWLRKIATGVYVPIFPVYVLGDDPTNREFQISIDAQLRVASTEEPISLIERAYVERLVRQRVHQPLFRAQVLRAYADRCTVCTLKHPILLDAAHITADSEREGVPAVSNGLALCKIHHAAYDSNYLGISPDYRVAINERLLDEVDGPMLKHGLQEMHGRLLTLPDRSSDRPDRDRLARRYELFRGTAG